MKWGARMRVAYETLGCKVNQYETEAMRELMEMCIRDRKKISFRKDKFWLYILGKLLAVGLSALVLVFAFSTAMQTSNIYMLAKDAFAKRTCLLYTSRCV